ncbi:MAG: hypothetical protein JXR70_11760 [Spirochaetales bacterium]|nr:hypothetical protein [Spirochaetales bacterium]
MVPIIIAAVLLILLIWAAGTFGKSQQSPRAFPAKEPGAPGFKQCPKCLKTLKPGERVRTLAFPGQKERLVHLFGCPDCQKGKTRASCPLCHKKLKAPDYLIGKLWEEDDKNRVHVIGCNRCHSGKS